MNKNKNKLIELSKKFNLSVKLLYKLNTKTDKVERDYWFDNSPYDLEQIFNSEEFKELGMSEKDIAYELFCLYNIRYSQENEFFID